MTNNLSKGTPADMNIDQDSSGDDQNIIAFEFNLAKINTPSVQNQTLMSFKDTFWLKKIINIG